MDLHLTGASLQILDFDPGIQHIIGQCVQILLQSFDHNIHAILDGVLQTLLHTYQTDPGRQQFSGLLHQRFYQQSDRYNRIALHGNTLGHILSQVDLDLLVGSGPLQIQSLCRNIDGIHLSQYIAVSGNIGSLISAFHTGIAVSLCYGTHISIGTQDHFFDF